MLSAGMSTNFIKKASSSHFNYWAGYVANFSLVGWLASQAFHAGNSALSLWQWLYLIAVGFLVWTYLEYVLHRYAYHEWPSPLSVGHDLHHDQPKALLGVPWYLTTVVIVGIFYGLASVFNPAKTGVVMASVWLGYIGYCALHHSVHHFDFKNPLFRKLRRHHLIHHAKHTRNWGITTTLWDRVLDTNASD